MLLLSACGWLAFCASLAWALAVILGSPGISASRYARSALPILHDLHLATEASAEACLKLCAVAGGRGACMFASKIEREETDFCACVMSHC